MKISAIIPVYNRPGAIEASINSVLNQTNPPSELIVVDDGSTDSTPEVVEGFGQAVRYIRQENQGQAVARNRGVLASQGDWIAFLDSDDTWRPEKLQRQTEFIAREPTDVCFHDLELVAHDGRSEASLNTCRERLGVERLETGLIGNPENGIMCSHDILFTSSLLVRRAAFEAVGGYRSEFRRCQDVDLHLRLARCFRFSFLDEALSVKDWSENADVAYTLERRLEIFRRQLVHARWEGLPDKVDVARYHLARSYRSLGGVHRRRRHYLRALACYANALLTTTSGRSIA